MKNKILGTLYAMAIGDAIGMPPELWSRKRIKEKYGLITDFLDGDLENEISYQYKKGNFTDDTAQALVILDSLIDTGFIPHSNSIANHILAWAVREDAFEKNILGPTSKSTLELFRQNKDATKFSDTATSNGAAMRIAPIGCLFHPDDKIKLCNYVRDVSKITHSSDITIAGACMIAMAVSSVLEYSDRMQMIEDVISIEEYAMSLGADTVCASLKKRILYGVSLAIKYADDEEKFLSELYDMFGATVNTIDSVPSAIAIAYFAFDVKKCALMCANLGGDTDTIGAMATAICGAISGVSSIDNNDINLINTANNVDFEFYAEHLHNKRGKI